MGRDPRLQDTVWGGQLKSGANGSLASRRCFLTVGPPSLRTSGGPSTACQLGSLLVFRGLKSQWYFSTVVLRRQRVCYYTAIHLLPLLVLTLSWIMHGCWVDNSSAQYFFLFFYFLILPFSPSLPCVYRVSRPRLCTTLPTHALSIYTGCVDFKPAHD